MADEQRIRMKKEREKSAFINKRDFPTITKRTQNTRETGEWSEKDSTTKYPNMWILNSLGVWDEYWCMLEWDTNTKHFYTSSNATSVPAYAFRNGMGSKQIECRRMLAWCVAIVSFDCTVERHSMRGFPSLSLSLFCSFTLWLLHQFLHLLSSDRFR